MEIHEFNPVIYPYMLWIVIDKKPDDVQKHFIQYNGEEFRGMDDFKMADACAINVQHKETRRYGVVLYFRSRKSMTCGIVAHESSHGAKLLFEHISADVSSHEPFEYVVGWMADCCQFVKRGGKR